MAETEPVKDEITGAEPLFSPSLFSQASELAASGEIKVSKEPDWTEEDIQGCIEMPFDLSALFLKCDALQLSPEQSKKLCKIWIRPFKKYLGEYPNMELYFALVATIGIVTEKACVYIVERDNRARDERERKEQLPERSGDRNLSLVDS